MIIAAIVLVAVVVYFSQKKKVEQGEVETDPVTGDPVIKTASVANNGGSQAGGLPILKIIPRPGGPVPQGWDCLVQVSKEVASQFKTGDHVTLPGSSKYPGRYKVFYTYTGKTVVNLYLESKLVGDDKSATVAKV